MGNVIIEVKQPTEADFEETRKRCDEQMIKEAQDALRKVIEICENHKSECERCPYYSAKQSFCCFEFGYPYDCEVEEEPIVRVVL